MTKGYQIEIFDMATNLIKYPVSTFRESPKGLERARRRLGIWKIKCEIGGLIEAGLRDVRVRDLATEEIILS